MSDYNQDGESGANEGTTLPGDNTATHNAELTPFFFAKIGYRSYDSRTRSSTGRTILMWTSSSHADRNIYYAGLENIRVLPTQYWGGNSTLAISFRCLVSTNNG